MIPFFVIFFLLYGGMHLYAFMRARAAFAFSPATGIAVALFMLVMILAPVIIRLSEKAGFEFFARLMSYIGYTWLGVLFLFVSASLVVDLYRFLLYSGQAILKKDFSSVTIPASYAFFIPLSFQSSSLYTVILKRSISEQKR